MMEHFTATVDAYNVKTLDATDFVVSGKTNTNFIISIMPDSGYLIDSINIMPRPANMQTITTGMIQAPLTNGQKFTVAPIDPPNTQHCFSICFQEQWDNHDPGINDYQINGFPLPAPNIIATTNPINCVSNTYAFPQAISVDIIAPYLNNCHPLNSPCQNANSPQYSWRITKIICGSFIEYFPQDTCSGPTIHWDSVITVDQCNLQFIVYVAPARTYLWTDIIADGLIFPYNEIGIDVHSNVESMGYVVWGKIEPISTNTKYYTNFQTNISYADSINCYQFFCGDKVQVADYIDPQHICSFAGWNLNAVPKYGCNSVLNSTPYITTWSMCQNTDVQGSFISPLILLAIGFTQSGINMYSVNQNYSLYPFLANGSQVNNVFLTDNNFSIPNYNTLTQTPMPIVNTTDVYFVFNKAVDMSTVYATQDENPNDPNYGAITNPWKYYPKRCCRHYRL